MKNLNDELADYLRNGAGDRSKDQIALLKAYSIIVSEVSVDNIFNATESMEDLYNTLA